MSLAHDPGAQPFGLIYPWFCAPISVGVLALCWWLMRLHWRWREQNRVHSKYVGGPLEVPYVVRPRGPHELCTVWVCVDRRHPGPCTKDRRKR